MSSASLRLLIFLPATLILTYVSFSPVFLMMYSAYNLCKQGDSIQLWRTPFPIWNQSVVPCPVLRGVIRNKEENVLNYPKWFIVNNWIYICMYHWMNKIGVFSIFTKKHDQIISYLPRNEKKVFWLIIYLKNDNGSYFLCNYVEWFTLNE